MLPRGPWSPRTRVDNNQEERRKANRHCNGWSGLGESVIRGIRRVSKPGVRKYAGVGAIPKVLGGVGTSILSTSKGVLATQKATQNKVGGEILCEVW